MGDGHGHSPALLAAIAERERELSALTDRLLSTQPGSVEAELEKMRQFVGTRLADLRGLLQVNVPRARGELQQHVPVVRMIPQVSGRERWYVAEGEWNLLAGYPEKWSSSPVSRLTSLDGCGGWI